MFSPDLTLIWTELTSCILRWAEPLPLAIGWRILNSERRVQSGGTTFSWTAMSSGNSSFRSTENDLHNGASGRVMRNTKCSASHLGQAT